MTPEQRDAYLALPQPFRNNMVYLSTSGALAIRGANGCERVPAELEESVAIASMLVGLLDAGWILNKDRQGQRFVFVKANVDKVIGGDTLFDTSLSACQHAAKENT